MPVQGDPVVLARAYAQLGVRQLYVADLDAIEGGSEQDKAVGAIAGTGSSIWLDAGISTVAQARRGLARHASRIVVGLETLTSFAALRDIAESIGPVQTIFSLDLRDGRPIASAPSVRDLSIDALAGEAVEAGAHTVIVLDLGRVGSSRGLDVVTLGAVRRAAAPDVMLLAGGGIRGVEDLRLAASAGCDGVLVATALHAAAGAELIRSAALLTRDHGNVTR
jgi:phosphoribosylformimino-5-aminoimidazole carboxamide ribotide isomerase